MGMPWSARRHPQPGESALWPGRRDSGQRRPRHRHPPRALGSRTDLPRCSGKAAIQQSRVALTGVVRSLRWRPMRRVIPKLFLITFSIGGI